MRRLPRTTWISIVMIGILTMLSSVTGSIGVNALTWLSPQVALALFVLISLSIVGLSLWQEGKKTASEPSATSPRENPNREIMLDRVQKKWITGFLDNRLYYNYGEQLLTLPLRERVGSRFDPVLSNPLETTKDVPPGTTLTHIFDQAKGELLILGEPGTGKTTLLLELTRDLLERAKRNPEVPIPVVLMLSSWATRKLRLEQWIGEELKVKYDIPSQIGKEWVKNDQLLLLLDGLDEVAPGALADCIKAINDYYRQSPQAHRPLVVCTRTQEYLDQSERLALPRAVIVQPLSFEQVGTYLDGLAEKGEVVEGIKDALRQGEELRAWVTTPLVLTVLLLAYHDKPEQELLALVKATPKEQRYLLFRNYVEQRLLRKDTRLREKTKHWLAWLARQMKCHHQREFYLEQFQPDWLPTGRRSWYRVSVGPVSGLFIGLLLGLVGGLFTLSPNQGIYGLLRSAHWLLVGLVAGSAFGLLIGLGAVLDGDKAREPVERLTWSWESFRSKLRQANSLDWAYGSTIEPVETHTWSWESFKSKLLEGSLFGGLPFGLLAGLENSAHSGLIGGLIYGLIGGTCFGLIYGLVGGFSGKVLNKRSTLSPNEGIHRSLRSGLLRLVCWMIGVLVFMLVSFLGIRVVIGLYGELQIGLFIGLFIGLVIELFFALGGGLNAVVRHYLLRVFLWQTGCTPAPWRCMAFLDDAVEQLLLCKVGGGYIFRHGLLQDYFAELKDVPPQDPPVR